MLLLTSCQYRLHDYGPWFASVQSKMKSDLWESTLNVHGPNRSVIARSSFAGRSCFAVTWDISFLSRLSSGHELPELRPAAAWKRCIGSRRLLRERELTCVSNMDISLVHHCALKKTVRDWLYLHHSWAAKDGRLKLPQEQIILDNPPWVIPPMEVSRFIWDGALHKFHREVTWKPSWNVVALFSRFSKPWFHIENIHGGRSADQPCSEFCAAGLCELFCRTIITDV